MATALTVKKLSTVLNVTQYDFDPDATTATDVGWVDMRDYRHFMFSFFRTVGTGTTAFTILANTASDGSGDEATIKTITPAAAPDAVGDYVFGEMLAEEVRQKGDEDGKAYRYISVNITLGTATDEGVVTYILGNSRFPRENLTADVVA